MPRKATKSKKSKTKAKKVLTPADIHKRNERKLIREFRAFVKALKFSQVLTDGIEIKFEGRTGELDDLFVYENIILIIEYTVGKAASSHIFKKKPLFDKICANVPGFLALARVKYQGLSKELSSMYVDSQFQVRILYVPLHDMSPEIIGNVPDVIVVQESLRKYFYALGKTIHGSSLIEFLTFLRLQAKDVAGGIISAGKITYDFDGHLLPASMSSFPTGYKVVSFYADPETLIAAAYVLRRDGWRDGSHLYQRILQRSKIAKMRKYLVEQGRVFVNNVIVTLPSQTMLTPPGKKTEPIDLNNAQAVTVSIPGGFNVVGIIDGQHRVFCYHEGADTFESNIAVLRRRQHLLVTGVVYPDVIDEKARLEFEARLFLEINDTQTRARPALRQDIETIVRPFSGIAVARRVIASLAKAGPYAGMFQIGYFDSPLKIKTSSIVSYGLRPLLKFDGNDSLFFAWKDPQKDRLKAREKKTAKGPEYEKDLALLEKYVEFCVKSVNEFLLAAKLAHGTSSWQLDSEAPSVLLRPTSINGLIACMRRVIQNELPLTLEAHKKNMTDFAKFDFGKYKSSAWSALGENLFKNHYGS